MALSRYEDLSREQLIQLLEKRDREKRLGLVWERDEIEADKAIDENFIAATLDQSLSDKPAPWRNLVIEGDNFDALRWLRMTHAGKIKCIYVDPPYNTGSKDWVYNDNYMDKEDRYRFSTWLEFLFRRFTLARELLTEDGVILVSINDDNRALMELMLDQVLPGMRVGSLVWRTRTGGNEGKKAFLSDNHEHILVFSNPQFRFAGTEKTFVMYSNPDSDPRGDWRKDNLTVSVERTSPRAGKAYYPIEDPQTGYWYPCNPDAVWRYASKKLSGESNRIKTKFMEEWIELGQVLFPENPRVEIWHSLEQLKAAIEIGDVPKSGRSPLLRVDIPDLEFFVGKPVAFGSPAFKRYKADLRNPTQPLSSWISTRSEIIDSDAHLNEVISGTNDEGAKEIKSVFSEKAFNYAKPVSLISGVISQASSPGDIVLDFFAGSATTAQAVMELNAEDGGDRTFIMVSSTEVTVDEPDKNICRDVTAERIRRLNASDDPNYANLAAEFAYLRTREIDFEDLDYDMKPSEAWNALEAIHGLPLTSYDASASFNEHMEGKQALIYVDRVTETVFERVEKLAKSGIGVTVYSWSPGQLRERLSALGVELQSVRATLVKKFQQ